MSRTQAILAQILETLVSNQGLPHHTAIEAPAVPASIQANLPPNNGHDPHPASELDDDLSIASTILATQSRHHLHPAQLHPPLASDISVAASNASFQQHTNFHTCHHDKHLTIAKYTHNFDTPGKTRNFIHEVTHALTANPFYSSLLLDSGSINYDAPPFPENQALFHFLLDKMDVKSQMTFRSFDTKLATYVVLKKIYKKISTVAFCQVQINQAQHQIQNNKWDPSSQSLREFTATFSDLKSILSNMPNKPSQSEYCRWRITLLPIQFKQVHYLLLMNNLPPNWSDVNKITDLAEATQIKIDTRLLKLSSPKPKDTPKHPRNTAPAPVPIPTPPPYPILSLPTTPLRRTTAADIAGLLLSFTEKISVTTSGGKWKQQRLRQASNSDTLLQLTKATGSADLNRAMWLSTSTANANYYKSFTTIHLYLVSIYVLRSKHSKLAHPPLHLILPHCS